MRMIKREQIENKFQFLALGTLYLERLRFRQAALARFKFNALYKKNRTYRRELWWECHEYLSYFLLKERPSDMHFSVKTRTASFRFVVVCVLFLLYVVYLQTLSTVVVGLV